ncbi:hypothetical protein FRB91_006196 [Serendipita sp. 411]|nr:hypothetical protein FRB91_006196 [Serendipita sp. 411]KAG9033332.1 hypothetical protein FS842_003959 [Serendipita sp. 407]
MTLDSSHRFVHSFVFLPPPLDDLPFVCLFFSVVGCLVAAFMSDAIITTFTILAMLQVGNQQTSNKTHRSLVGRIARFTALSAAIPAVFSLLQVALVMTPKKYSRWHMTVNFVLAKTYDLSLLWTIAYRKRVIERQKQQQQEQHEKQQQQQYRLNIESADPPPPHHLVQLALGVGLAASNGNRMDEKEMNGSSELLNNTSMFARTLRFSAMPMGAGGIVVGGGGGGLNPNSNLYPYSNPVLAQNRFEVARTPESDLEMERLPSSSPQTLKEKE